MPTLVPALGIDQVIITIADAPQVQLRRILSICERIPVRAQMIPAMYDLLQGKVLITHLREVRVEDLLHREAVSLEENDLARVPGRQGGDGTGGSGEIDILFTGVRPGEKLFEELQYLGESIDKARHPKIAIGEIAGVPASIRMYPVRPPGEC